MRIVLVLCTLLFLSAHGRCANLPPIRTVFIVLFENKSWSEIKGSTNAPYINKTLLPMSSYCENYNNVPGLHPSLLNYLWLEAGINFGFYTEPDPPYAHTNTTSHLSTFLSSAGISWKAYQEYITGNVLPLTSSGAYSARHNPFLYFDDVTGTNDPYYPYGLAHIRPYSELGADLTNNTVARYNFLIINDCADMHTSCNPTTNMVLQGDMWLAAELPKILSSQAYTNGGAVFITFDECDESISDTRIGMIVLSPLARGGGYNNSIYYTHSSTLRTFQEIFGVGPFLGDAANATDLSDLFVQFGIERVLKLPSGAIQLTAVGVTPGRTNLVEASTNLSSWTAISTNVATSTTFAIVDDEAKIIERRFYRLVQLP